MIIILVSCAKCVFEKDLKKEKEVVPGKNGNKLGQYGKSNLFY